jgi:tRNA/rRNA methyltransferase
MSLSFQDNLHVVLIEPEYAGNLGSVMRAMANMGTKNLTLVNPKADRTEGMAKAMSVAAYPLLLEAKIVASLPDALEDSHWSLGLTRRSGRHRREFLAMDQFSPLVHERLQNNEIVSLVFGPESRGFTTKEGNIVHHLVSIPTTEDYPSLNLAQAVIVTLYELVRDVKSSKERKKHIPAKMSDLEGMYDHLTELAQTINYWDHQNPDHIPRNLRSLFNRAQPTGQEIRMIRGICRNALYKIKRHKK